MAIFGWGTTNNTLPDLRLFEAERGLPAIPVTINYFGAETSITDSIGEVEWDLDTQASSGMAPNAVALNHRSPAARRRPLWRTLNRCEVLVIDPPFGRSRS